MGANQAMLVGMCSLSVPRTPFHEQSHQNFSGRVNITKLPTSDPHGVTSPTPPTPLSRPCRHFLIGDRQPLRHRGDRCAASYGDRSMQVMPMCIDLGLRSLAAPARRRHQSLSAARPLQASSLSAMSSAGQQRYCVTRRMYSGGRCVARTR